MRALLCLFVAGGLGLLAWPAAAEEPVSLPRGLRVRMATASGRVEGTILAVGPTGIEVMAGGHPRKIPLDSIARLEVSTGHADNLKKGAIIGGVAGLAIGILGVAGAPSCDRCAEGNEECLRTCGEEWGFAIPIITAGMGVAAGAGVGHLIRPETWADVPLARVRVGLAPVRGRGAAVRVSVRF